LEFGFWKDFQLILIAVETVPTTPDDVSVSVDTSVQCYGHFSGLSPTLCLTIPK